MGDLLKDIKKLITGNTGTLRNFIAALVVLGSESLETNLQIFKCPPKGNAAYGYMFIFVPALVLFLLSLLSSLDTLKIITQGCCHVDVTEKQLVRKCCPCRRPRWGCKEEVLKVLFYSLVAGCFWIVLSLLEKDYYVCAVVGRREQLIEVTGENKKKLQERFDIAKKDSQIYGFCLLAVILGTPLLFLSIRRCCYLRSLSSIPSRREYENLKTESAKQTLKKIIKDHAEAQGKDEAERRFSQKMMVNKEATSNFDGKASPEYKDYNPHDFEENVGRSSSIEMFG